MRVRLCCFRFVVEVTVIGVLRILWIVVIEFTKTGLSTGLRSSALMSFISRALKYCFCITQNVYGEIRRKAQAEGLKTATRTTTD